MEVAASKLKLWREKPDIFVREVFGATPDPWQDETLKAFPTNPRVAMKASKGPGKSCLMAWVAWNFLLTRPRPNIAAVSISGDNLRDGLWKEMALWQLKSPILQEAFVVEKERIYAKVDKGRETWWMAARQWSKSADVTTVGNTLAGLHAPYIMFILDESGGLPDAIMASAEAALSNCQEGHIIQAGNPTNLSGPLYRACTSERSLWYVVEINGDPDDPKRSPRVDVKWARDQILKFGKDNPWVRVNVFGQFPPSSFNSLLGTEDVNAAIKRLIKESDYNQHPFVLGVDVARFGDDSCVAFPRQGLRAFDPKQYRNIDSNQGAEYIVRLWNELDLDACFIDNTGGFGSGWIDNLYRLGKDPIGIHFSEKSTSEKYYNKRSQMAFECADWIKNGGCIPDIPELTRALVETTYTFKDDKLIIEPKDELKERLLYSPDHMDALWLTFALPVERKPKYIDTMRPLQVHQIEYNPFSRDRVLGG